MVEGPSGAVIPAILPLRQAMDACCAMVTGEAIVAPHPPTYALLYELARIDAS